MMRWFLIAAGMTLVGYGFWLEPGMAYLLVGGILTIMGLVRSP